MTLAKACGLTREICLLLSGSDSSLAIAFSIFLWQNVRVFHPNLANILGAPLRVCTNILLSQLHKMLILLIRSHCKVCPLPTIRSCVFVLFATDKHAKSYCRQCAHFTTGTNVQNQHFAVLRQKVSFYIYVVVLQSDLSNLDGKLERFITKKWKKWMQTRVRLFCHKNVDLSKRIYVSSVMRHIKYLRIEIWIQMGVFFFIRPHIITVESLPVLKALDILRIALFMLETGNARVRARNRETRREASPFDQLISPQLTKYSQSLRKNIIY